MKSIKIAFLCLLFSNLFAQEPSIINLSGKWRFFKDSTATGIAQKVYLSTLPESIYLPGSMTVNGKGDKVTLTTKWTATVVDSSFYKLPKYAKYRQSDNLKVPFWLTPSLQYVGNAWYQKEIEIPQSWKEKHIELFLERCHWETRVWIDDKDAGIENALCAPHVYDLTKFITPGKHKISICVDNRIKGIDPGRDASSLTDNSQTNWNGIIGRIELSATSKLAIKNVKLYPNISNKTVKVVLQLDNQTGVEKRGKIQLCASGFNSFKSSCEPAQSFDYKATNGINTFEYIYSMGNDVRLWDEFSPNLYTMFVNVNNEKENLSHTAVQFGMKEFTIRDTRFYINGRQTFLRGTLECCIFPITGYPAMNVDEWKRIFAKCRSYGLNHMRFHSWCPPEAAFDAADQLGFYLQIECSAWAVVGDSAPVDTWLYEEGEHIVDAFGNHPSFCLMTYGVEPHGNKMEPWLSKFETYWKKKDSRRVYTSGSGWPVLPENDYHVMLAARIQNWGAGLSSIINSQSPSTAWDHSNLTKKYDKPIVSHETGQWCAYPDLSESRLYTGVLKPGNLEIFKESLEKNHLGDYAHDFMMASGKLQTLCYKADIEGLLRTPGIAGFQLLDLHDFPGQGTATVGVLNAFWNEKGYVTAKEYSRFCNSLVPLARISKLNLTTADTFKASIESANFGKEILKNSRIEWFIRNSKKEVIATGTFTKDISIDKGVKLGDINVPLNAFKAPEKYNLEVEIGESANDWDFWVYPQSVPEIMENNLILVSELNNEVAKMLQKGKNILFIVPKGGVKPDKGGDIAIGFSSIFWNTSYTSKQAPHTLGLLCNTSHPALSEFPTDYFSNYNWWDIIAKSKPMVLDDLVPELKPIVSVIDDWYTNRRLGLIFEAAVSKGKILICSADLLQNKENRPEARQLLYSLSKYAAGAEFSPKVNVPFEVLLNLFRKPSVMEGAKILKTDSFEPGYEAEKAIDQNLNSFWHSSWANDKNFYPHEIQIDLSKRIEFCGFSYSPRQDKVTSGAIAEYEFYVSDNPQNWGNPVSKGIFTQDKAEKVVKFSKPVKGRYFRFVGVKGFGVETNASIAEIKIIQ